MGNNNKQVDKFCWVIGFLVVVIAIAIFNSTPPALDKLDKYIGYCLLIVIFMLTTRDALKNTKKLSFKKVFKASSAALLANGTFYLGLYFIIRVFLINPLLVLIPPVCYLSYQLVENTKIK